MHYQNPMQEILRPPKPAKEVTITPPLISDKPMPTKTVEPVKPKQSVTPKIVVQPEIPKKSTTTEIPKKVIPPIEKTEPKKSDLPKKSVDVIPKIQKPEKPPAKSVQPVIPKKELLPQMPKKSVTSEVTKGIPKSVELPKKTIPSELSKEMPKSVAVAKPPPSKIPVATPVSPTITAIPVPAFPKEPEKTEPPVAKAELRKSPAVNITRVADSNRNSLIELLELDEFAQMEKEAEEEAKATAQEINRLRKISSDNSSDFSADDREVLQIVSEDEESESIIDRANEAMLRIRNLRLSTVGEESDEDSDLDADLSLIVEDDEDAELFAKSPPLIDTRAAMEKVKEIELSALRTKPEIIPDEPDGVPAPIENVVVEKFGENVDFTSSDEDSDDEFAKLEAEAALEALKETAETPPEAHADVPSQPMPEVKPVMEIVSEKSNILKNPFEYAPKVQENYIENMTENSIEGKESHSPVHENILETESAATMVEKESYNPFRDSIEHTIDEKEFYNDAADSIENMIVNPNQDSIENMIEPEYVSTAGEKEPYSPFHDSIENMIEESSSMPESMETVIDSTPPHDSKNPFEDSTNETDVEPIETFPENIPSRENIPSFDDESESLDEHHGIPEKYSESTLGTVSSIFPTGMLRNIFVYEMLTIFRKNGF